MRQCLPFHRQYILILPLTSILLLTLMLMFMDNLTKQTDNGINPYDLATYKRNKKPQIALDMTSTMLPISDVRKSKANSNICDCSIAMEKRKVANNGDYESKEKDNFLNPRNLELEGRNGLDNKGNTDLRRKLTAILYSIPSRNTKSYENVRSVIQSLGYQVLAGFSGDVYWLHRTPFDVFPDFLSSLSKSSLLNHIPGMEPLFDKKLLLTRRDISVISPTFILPADNHTFMAYANGHKHKLWITKDVKQNGAVIKPVKDIVTEALKKSIVREYIPNPLLVDNRKFDIGVFGVITSVIPLRMYIYVDDFLLRFCTKDYIPFNPSITKTYVVSESFVNVWQLPSTEKIDRAKMRQWDILQVYLKQKEYDVQILRNNIINAVTKTAAACDKSIAENTEKWVRKKSFRRTFEFVRFDLIVDSTLRVWVMQVHSSPITHALQPEARLTAFYKTLLEDAMILAGLRNSSWDPDTQAQLLDLESVPERELLVDDSRCNLCKHRDCADFNWVCRTCQVCWKPEENSHFRRSVIERRRAVLSQGRWQRVLPSSFKDQSVASRWEPTRDSLFNVLSASSRINALWLHRKCLQDKSWCK